MWICGSRQGALTVAIALAQIGEFSFILSTLGRELSLFTAEGSNTIIATAIVSIVLNPLAYRAINPINSWVAKWPQLMAALDRSAALDGGAVSKEMRAARNVPMRVDRLWADRTNGRAPIEGIRRGVDGDRAEHRYRSRDSPCRRRRRLRRCDAARDADRGRNSKRPQPDPDVGGNGQQQRSDPRRPRGESVDPGLARGAYLRDLPELKAAGADSVYTGEVEVALAFVEDLLLRLGATPEQVERERTRAHEELFRELPAVSKTIV